MPRFFFVGCWNNDNCEGDFLDYRKAVFRKLARDAKKFDFGVIAGDNIYSHTTLEDGKKKKVYLQNTWDFAKDMLPRFTKPIFGTIGNHDVANERVLHKQLEIGEDISNNSLTHSLFLGPMNCYALNVSPSLRILFIDTNVLGTSIPKLYQQQEYKHRSVHEYMSYRTEDAVLKWLRRELSNKSSKGFEGLTVVVGHEPIVSIKEKAKSLKIGALNSYRELLNILHNIKRVMYMCADVHSFQAWNIPWNGKYIPMVVAGTGGASPDNPPISLYSEYVIDNHKLELVAAKAPYGYCDIDIQPRMYTITYVPIGCGKRKTVLRYDSTNRKLVVIPTMVESVKMSDDCSQDAPEPIHAKYCDMTNNPVL